MQTKALKLRENFYWAGILDDTLRVFDIIMSVSYTHLYGGRRIHGRSLSGRADRKPFSEPENGRKASGTGNSLKNSVYFSEEKDVYKRQADDTGQAAEVARAFQRFHGLFGLGYNHSVDSVFRAVICAGAPDIDPRVGENLRDTLQGAFSIFCVYG